MKINEYTYITGNHNGKEVSGYILFDENNVPFITGEKCKLTEMTNIRITEADPKSNIDDIVNNDFNKLDKKKVIKMKDKEAEKIGAAREKELKKAGVKMQNGDYTNKFIAAQKALAAVGATVGDLGDSKVLVKYKKNESIENSNNKISEDNLTEDEHIYGDTIPVTVKTSLTGKEVPVNTNDISNDDNWSHYRSSNQQATDTINYTDETLKNIDDNIKDSDNIYYSDLDVDSDYILPDENSDDSNEDLYDDTDFSDESSYSITNDTPTDPIENAINSDNSSSLDNDIDSYDYPDEDVHIDIKNPNDVPITISVGDNSVVKQAEKENEISEEIENELDSYTDNNDSFSESDFMNHIISKYNLNKDLFNESNDLYDNIDIAIKEISKTRTE